MTELKTLKDLSRIQRNDSYRIVEEDTLKAEAVKWVKAVREEDKILSLDKFLRYFFNLTEEDLEEDLK